MAVSSSSSEKAASRRSKPAAATDQSSPLRTTRIKRGLTQAELARLAGMHRNSISKLENGTTQEVTAENANALATVLKTSISALGFRVRAATKARSIRFRRLTAEQRQIVDELLSLPPEDYVLIRGAIERLRQKRTRKKSRGVQR
ncbi:MAG TPA: helix-turn-helix transcriptional regulator [Thermoanaerobaculia bacterium]|nr:helix-turn-helix transcriptional regulator [Thermoanaerobaculia bacterium]